MAETELERAERRYEQAKARLQGLRNREAARQRKLDTRRKVILGGALLDLASRDDNAAAMAERLIRNLPREQDRKAFTDWQVPSPAPASDHPVPLTDKTPSKPDHPDDTTQPAVDLADSAVSAQGKDDRT